MSIIDDIMTSKQNLVLWIYRAELFKVDNCIPTVITRHVSQLLSMLTNVHCLEARIQHAQT